MPKIPWKNLPQGIRQHLIDRLHDPSIDLSDLNQIRRWIDTSPEVPEGDWHKDFGSFKLCGRGALAKTFLLRDQIARGQEV